MKLITRFIESYKWDWDMLKGLNGSNFGQNQKFKKSKGA
jgi:hypothetical protein